MNNKTIREEFEEKFKNDLYSAEAHQDQGGDYSQYDAVESFLHRAILTQLQEIEDMVEGLKIKDKQMGVNADFGKCDAYNEALSDILSALKEKKDNLNNKR